MYHLLLHLINVFTDINYLSIWKEEHIFLRLLLVSSTLRLKMASASQKMTYTAKGFDLCTKNSKYNFSSAKLSSLNLIIEYSPGANCAYYITAKLCTLIISHTCKSKKGKRDPVKLYLTSLPSIPKLGCIS